MTLALDTSEAPREVRDEPAVAKDAIVYVSPYSHPTNQYSANLRRSLAAAGFEVKSPDRIWRCKAWLDRQPHYIFFSWFEDRVLKKGTRPRVLDIALFGYKLLATLMQGVKIVWVRHNHRAHGQDLPDWLANRVLGFLEWASVAIVVHSERLAQKNDWYYLPHPLYDIDLQTPASEFSDLLPDLESRIAVLGQIRASKGLDEMLRQWPRDVPLVLAGKPVTHGHDELLKQIISERGLDVVTIFRNLNSSEFDHVLGNCRAVYIANPDETMVVSGVFFHAASIGTPLVIRRSSFSSEVCELCDFAIEIESPEELDSSLQEHPFPNRPEIVAEAELLFGQGRFQQEVEKLPIHG